jgi:hypothetical protein
MRQAKSLRFRGHEQFAQNPVKQRLVSAKSVAAPKL